jgi:hypothetical protein
LSDGGTDASGFEGGFAVGVEGGLVPPDDEVDELEPPPVVTGVVSFCAVFPLELAPGTASTAPPHPPEDAMPASAEPPAIAVRKRERRLDGRPERREARMAGPGSNPHAQWNLVESCLNAVPL